MSLLLGQRPRRIVWAIVLCSMNSCAGQERAAMNRSPEAERVVATYLAQSSVRVGEAVDPGLFACELMGASDNMLGLADHEVLASSVTGDTAFVQAQVTAVARVRLAVDGYYEVVPTIIVDTLSWRLLATADGGWGICGYAMGTGVDFVRLAHLGTRVRWTNGSSIESLLRRADSVFRDRDDENQ